MRGWLSAAAGLLLGIALTACGAGENTGDMDLFGKDSMSEEIVDVGETADADDANDADTGRTGEAVLSFDSFDGGGPEFTVLIDDEAVVAYRQEIRYKSSAHGEMTGAGKNVEIVFTGIRPGETEVLIEERSPIADNLDRRYKVVVDDERNVRIEEISVKDINEESEDMSLYP